MGGQRADVEEARFRLRLPSPTHLTSPAMLVTRFDVRPAQTPGAMCAAQGERTSPATMTASYHGATSSA